MATSANSDPSVHERILKFRTLTSLLEILQDSSSLNTGLSVDRRTYIPNSNHSSQAGVDRSLSALATLLVRRQGEVTAVALRSPPTAESPMDILVSRHIPREVPNNVTLPAPSAASMALETQIPVIICPHASDIDPLHPMDYLKEHG
jgi:hypothetical protein